MKIKKGHIALLLMPSLFMIQSMEIKRSHTLNNPRQIYCYNDAYNKEHIRCQPVDDFLKEY